MTDAQFDDRDRRILALLARDGRQSLREIGGAVGLSAPAVRDRILRLMEGGVITGFTVDINPRALGYTLEAVVRIEPLPGKLARVRQTLEETPEVTECLGITGDDCFIARLLLREMSDLDRLLGPLHDMARTSTSLVKTTPIARRLPPIPTR